MKSFKRILSYLLVSVFVISLFPSVSFAKEPVIIINPGHSVGVEPGTTAYEVTEAEINETLANALVKLLQNRGYKVYITHTTDPDLENAKLLDQEEGSYLRNVRGAVNEMEADLVLSLHHNSGGPESTGTEIYWSSYRDYDTEGVYIVDGLWGSGEEAFRDESPSEEALESLRMAQILEHNLRETEILPYRETIERDDYLPAHVNAPCILVEGGFLSNPQEALFLDSEEYVISMSTVIADSVDEFFGIIRDKEVSIMGESEATVEDLINFYTLNSPAAFPDYYLARGVDLSTFTQFYLEEASTENIKVEVAFAQAMLETGYLQFGGDVGIEQFNFAGLGAAGGGISGIDFAQIYGDYSYGIRMGIRAHIQHLKSYASTDDLNQGCVDPRFYFVQRGSAPTVDLLSGSWAADPEYGNKILSLIEKI